LETDYQCEKQTVEFFSGCTRFHFVLSHYRCSSFVSSLDSDTLSALCDMSHWSMPYSDHSNNCTQNEVTSCFLPLIFQTFIHFWFTKST